MGLSFYSRCEKTWAEGCQTIESAEEKCAIATMGTAKVSMAITVPMKWASGWEARSPGSLA
jgi:hypothetical protein